MKNYLVITPFFPNNNSYRGYYVYDQINEIRNQTNYNIIVIVITSIYDKKIKPYNYNGFKCIPFTVIDLPSFLFPGIFQNLNNRRFKKLLLKNKIFDADIIHSHVNYPAGHLAISLKKIFKKSKFLIQHHGLDIYQSLNGRFRLISNLYQRFFENISNIYLSNYDFNIGVSKLVINQIKKDVFDQSKKIILYNGVNSSNFFYKKTKPFNLFTIGCVGNFLKTKDQSTLIQVCLKLINMGYKIQLILVGDGPMLKKCKNLIPKKNRDSFIFYSEINHFELNDFYNKINLFVLPSYFEAFGCVYTEAWATKTNFIAVKGQGIEEVMTSDMRENNLILPENQKDLFNKILNFYKNDNSDIKFNSDLLINNTIKNFLSKTDIL